MIRPVSFLEARMIPLPWDAFTPLELLLKNQTEQFKSQSPTFWSPMGWLKIVSTSTSLTCLGQTLVGAVEHLLVSQPRLSGFVYGPTFWVYSYLKQLAPRRYYIVPDLSVLAASKYDLLVLYL